MKIVDIVLYNGEEDLFNLRYDILEPYVDEFVVIEFDKTFSGNPKQAHPINLSKVSYHFFTQIRDLSPNHPPAFAMEYNQREMMKECLTHLNDEDVVFMGDVDEIWNTDAIKRANGIKLRLKVYSYYLNNRSSEDFVLGPVKDSWKAWKGHSFNYQRSYAPLTEDYLGWHFTSMGGPDKIRTKIESYGHQEFNIPEVKNNLEWALANGKDFIGRDFTYQMDESEWPEYLKEHRHKYEYLLK